MSLETDRGRVADASLDGTDPFFGFLVGLYAAVLIAPWVVAVALRVTTDAAALYVVLLGSVAAVVTGVGYLARSERLAVRLGATPLTWVAAVVPVGYLAALLGLLAVVSRVPAAVAGVSMLAAISGLFVGLGLAVAARNRHAKAVVASAEEYARFDARAPERDRRLIRWSVALLMGVGTLGFLGSLLVDGLEAFRWLFHFAIAAGAGLTGANAERTVAVIDAGLLVGNPLSKRVRPWSAFEGYSVTDEAVVVRRAGWSAWGLRDVRRDRDEIEDPEAVDAALGRVLPRR